MSWLINLRPELLDAARARNAVPGKPKLLNKNGVFDVISIGLTEVAVTVLSPNEPFLDLNTGHRIQRPRS